MKRNVVLFVLLGILVVLAVVVYTQWGPGSAAAKHDVEATLEEIKPPEDAAEVPYGGAVEGVKPPVLMGGGGEDK